MTTTDPAAALARARSAEEPGPGPSAGPPVTRWPGPVQPLPAAPEATGVDLGTVLRRSLAARDRGGRLRAVPSAGALHPVNAHVLAGPGCSVPPGRYAYDPLAHRLRRRGPAPAGAPAGALVVLTVTARRTESHYAHRAWPLLLLDTGHALAALALAGAHALCLDADASLLAAAAALPADAHDWPDTTPEHPLAAAHFPPPTPPGPTAARVRSGARGLSGSSTGPAGGAAASSQAYGPTDAYEHSGATSADGLSGGSRRSGSPGPSGAWDPSGSSTGPAGEAVASGRSGWSQAYGPTDAYGHSGATSAGGLSGGSGRSGSPGPSGAWDRSGSSTGPAGGAAASGRTGSTGSSHACGSTDSNGRSGATSPGGVSGSTALPGLSGGSIASGVSRPSRATSASGVSRGSGPPGPAGGTGSGGSVGRAALAAWAGGPAPGTAAAGGHVLDVLGRSGSGAGTWQVTPALPGTGRAERRSAEPPLRGVPRAEDLRALLAAASSAGAGPRWCVAVGGPRPALLEAVPGTGELRRLAGGDARPTLAVWGARQSWIAEAGAVLLAYGCPDDASPRRIRQDHLTAGLGAGLAQAAATRPDLATRPVGSWQQADLGAALGGAPGRDWIIHALAIGTTGKGERP
ncbi:hypothetical protein [Streptomyces sp. SYSU K21746]